jgi:hypothetical protein
MTSIPTVVQQCSNNDLGTPAQQGVPTMLSGYVVNDLGSHCCLCRQMSLLRNNVPAMISVTTAAQQYDPIMKHSSRCCYTIIIKLTSYKKTRETRKGP